MSGRARFKIAGLLIWAAGLSAVVLSGITGPALVTVDDLGQMLSAAFAVATTAYTAMLARGGSRRGWLLISLGMASWGSGQVVWTLYELVFHRLPGNILLMPIPFLLFAPLAGIGLLLLPGAPQGAFSRGRTVMDGLVVATALLGAGLVVGMATPMVTGDAYTVATRVALPVTDVIMVAIVIVTAARVGFSTPVTLLLSGLAIEAVADFLYTYLDSTGTYWTGHPVDVLFFIGFALIGAASIASRGRAQPQQVFERRATVVSNVLCYAAVAQSIPLAIWQSLHGGMTPAMSFSGAILIALLLIRQYLATLESQRLSSDRERARIALEGSQRRLQSVLASAPVALLSIDAEGQVTLAEGAALRSLPASVRRHRAIEEFRDVAPGGVEVIRRAFAGQASSAEVTFADRVFEIHGTPVRGRDGRVTGVSAVALDITERHEVEEARRESEAKTRFLANMSHELRTPLNSIIGFTQLMEMGTGGPVTERQRHYLDNIETSGRQLLELISEVLDLTRVAQGRLRIDVQDFELDAVLREAADSVRPLAARGGLSLVVEAAPGLAVHGDPRRVEQVVLNLLSNAIKFTHEGGVRVQALAVGDRVALRVIDTGAGIAAEDRERIFTEFTQLETSRTREAQGSGLGLALSRQLARLMGGDVTVQSEPGRGSTFTLWLPAATTARQPRDEPDASEAVLAKAR